MGLSLNHVSIRTSDLEACRRFYVDVLGLAAGPRPDFPFPGVWLYAGPTTAWSNAVVHVIGIDPANPERPGRLPGAARRHGRARQRCRRPRGLPGHGPGADACNGLPRWAS